MLKLLSRPFFGNIQEAVDKAMSAPFEPFSPIRDKMSLKLPHDLEILEEYKQVAKGLGYVPPILHTMRVENERAVKLHEMVSILLDLGLPYYPRKKVSSYMDNLMKQLEKTARYRYHTLSWNWCALSSYQHAVPLEMLERANKIKQYYQENRKGVNITFLVSDYRATKPDPFIAFVEQEVNYTLSNTASVHVFGVWDEPSFGNILPKDKQHNQ